MITVRRDLRLSGAVHAASLRTAEFNGSPHLVVPTIALVGDSVIWANGATAPEFVPKDVLAKAPQGWNGRPVLADHPKDRNGSTSANEPTTLERAGLGQAFNAEIRDGNLCVELWIDKSRTAAEGQQRLIERLLAGDETIEVSVGAFVVVENVSGTAPNGKRYAAIWREIVQDHIALLPEGVIGACSVEMGCGAPRAATLHFVTASGITIEGGDRPQQEDGMKTKDERIAALIASAQTPYQESDRPMLEHADEARLTAMEAAIVDEPVVKRTLRERLSALFSAPFRYGVGQDEMSDVDLRGALDAALRASEPGYVGIESVVPGESTVVYSVAPTDAWSWISRTFAVASDGVVSLNDDRQEVRPVTRFEPVAEAKAAAAAGPQAAPCGCAAAAATAKAAHEGDTIMTDEQKKARAQALVDNPATAFGADDMTYLTGLSDERLTAFEAALPKATTQAAAPAATEPAATVVAPAPTTAAATKKTEEQWLAEAPDDVREEFLANRAAKAKRHASMVTALKTAQAEYSEAELKAMSIAELEKISRLVDVEVEPVADYAGRGAVRDAGAADDYIRNPPDPWAQQKKA